MYELGMLLGMPIYKIMNEMPYEEYIGWCKYMNERPEGWKDDLRAYHIMSSMATIKRKPEEIFPAVRAVMKSQAPVKLEEGILPSGGILAKMMQAKGGDEEFDIAKFVKEVKDGRTVQRQHGGRELQSRVEESGFRS